MYFYELEAFVWNILLMLCYRRKWFPCGIKETQTKKQEQKVPMLTLQATYMLIIYAGIV